MQMIFEIEDNVIKSLKIIGGCPGNTIGVSRLVVGKKR
ncbi:MAG: TSCPD domain-containing protein [Clostridia bacterium]